MQLVPWAHESIPMKVRFDESLPTLAQVIQDELGLSALWDGVALRDVNGRLAFFVDAELDSATVERVSIKLRQALGPYARTDRVLAGKSDFGAMSILTEPHPLTVTLKDGTLRLIDRRLVGADWLRLPADRSTPPPRFIFASLKGGVGRSTALAVAAAHLASQGLRILVVDLDMEAPGLGAMLLDENTVPKFGIIDALVENSLSGLDPTFMADLVGPSGLSHREGRIDVIPAFGKKSLDNPGEVLSKIARAYAEDIDETGINKTILDQVRFVIDRISKINRYDAILVDARAGLHETTPAAILGLGAAEVFLFGLNEPQTFQGYRALFAHLYRLCGQGPDRGEFFNRITMVRAKASTDIDAHREFIEKCEELFDVKGLSAVGLRQIAPQPLPPAEPFNDVPWDENEPTDEELGIKFLSKSRDPVAIFNDTNFELFDPRRRRELLTAEIYNASYGHFLKRIDLAMQACVGESFDVA